MSNAPFQEEAATTIGFDDANCTIPINPIFPDSTFSSLNMKEQISEARYKILEQRIGILDQKATMVEYQEMCREIRLHGVESSIAGLQFTIEGINEALSSRKQEIVDALKPLEDVRACQDQRLLDLDRKVHRLETDVKIVLQKLGFHAKGLQRFYIKAPQLINATTDDLANPDSLDQIMRDAMEQSDPIVEPHHSIPIGDIVSNTRETTEPPAITMMIKWDQNEEFSLQYMDEHEITDIFTTNGKMPFVVVNEEIKFVPVKSIRNMFNSGHILYAEAFWYMFIVLFRARVHDLLDSLLYHKRRDKPELLSTTDDKTIVQHIKFEDAPNLQSLQILCLNVPNDLKKDFTPGIFDFEVAQPGLILVDDVTQNLKKLTASRDFTILCIRILIGDSIRVPGTMDRLFIRDTVTVEHVWYTQHDRNVKHLEQAHSYIWDPLDEYPRPYLIDRFEPLNATFVFD
ncbi:hypothetical protein Dda_6991 [Drechslerella dactyloides]|uniref:Uncharacterized protein n=1 Tax=Drechslerella dactyloides TaxID=74499 RepID=A0AAD6ISY4_DREDA|nr:hypothetical protein Dda_6991 [Drechslerella dactyloides]